MLSQLTIRQFTLIDALELEFAPGLTVLTGETGAGKSIVLDALGLVLGDRADSRFVRPGCDSAEIIAEFDLGSHDAARDWLAERDCGADGECILRRLITTEGRSRAWINGRPQPLQELRSLGELLVDLHGQHEHQSLLKKATHTTLLDAYGGHDAARQGVAEAWTHWDRLGRLHAELETSRLQRQERRDLLRYQLDEFAELRPRAGEFAELDAEQQRLAHAGEICTTLNEAMARCRDDEGDGIEDALQQVERRLARLPGCGPALDAAREMLESARIQVEEARHALAELRGRTELDPQRLTEVEARLDALLQLARKHRVEPELLAELEARLQQEYDALSGDDERLESLSRELEQARQAYETAAATLTRQRSAAARQLAEAVQALLADLAMERARFEVRLVPRDGDPHRLGAEQAEFRVATLPGAEPDSLARIASGGELSRISLAIQVITAASLSIPTLVFDEVDVGIGGATADTVGQLLRRLAAQRQVLCVTHLPQVAARGHQHLRVSKTSSRSSARAELEALVEAQRVDEIARMLGGSRITATSREHARELLTAED